MLRVTELNNEHHLGEELFDEEFDDVAVLNDEPENDDACKFWWSSEETEENPKLWPCMCTGSMRYIHYQWLKQWIDSRKQVKDQAGVHSIIWKNFDWEICKKPYPYVFEYRGKRWGLHTPYRPDDEYKTPYLIIESMKNDRNSVRVVHTLTFTKDKSEYKLGRGHEADVRIINDISVSRWHMNIKYENGDFVLSDCKSKFGTLVLVRNEMSIVPGEQKAIQVNRTVMNFQLVENSLLPTDNPFNEVTANRYFERISHVPQFGKEEICENIDLPNVDNIQRKVPEFKVHGNNEVIRGTPLPRNEYFVNPDQL